MESYKSFFTIVNNDELKYLLSTKPQVKQRNSSLSFFCMSFTEQCQLLPKLVLNHIILCLIKYSRLFNTLYAV